MFQHLLRLGLKIGLICISYATAQAITPYSLQIVNALNSESPIMVTVTVTASGQNCYQLKLDPGTDTTIYSNSCGRRSPITIVSQAVDSPLRVFCVWPYAQKHNGGVMFQASAAGVNTQQAMNASCAIR